MTREIVTGWQGRFYDECRPSVLSPDATACWHSATALSRFKTYEGYTPIEPGLDHAPKKALIIPKDST